VKDLALSASVRRATVADAPAVAALVNQAYVIETFFVDGDRTSAADIIAMMQTGQFVVLEYAGGLAGAVYVDQTTAKQSASGYFGMLAVAPELQGAGLGKRLVRIAEALCEAAGCEVMTLRIINLREELGRWYRSLGYREVGTAPYTHRPVKQPCHFIEMQRELRTSVTLAA
jgi:N-acetylglutamate synthase-like GNAT family acetyltransferase